MPDTQATVRWSAPADTTAVTLASGPFAVSDGAVDLPADLTEGEKLGLVAAGFSLAVTAPDPAPVKPTKTKAADPAPEPTADPAPSA